MNVCALVVVGLVLLNKRYYHYITSLSHFCLSQLYQLVRFCQSCQKGAQNYWLRVITGQTEKNLRPPPLSGWLAAFCFQALVCNVFIYMETLSLYLLSFILYFYSHLKTTVWIYFIFLGIIKKKSKRIKDQLASLSKFICVAPFHSKAVFKCFI